MNLSLSHFVKLRSERDIDSSSKNATPLYSMHFKMRILKWPPMALESEFWKRAMLLRNLSFKVYVARNKVWSLLFLPLNLVLSVKLESDFLVTDFDVCYL